jgi:hypothetical protein
VSEPEEGGLRDLAKRLGAIKKELMVLNRELIVSQPPALAMEAQEAIKASQKTIKVALRVLGAASDISEADSLDTLPPPRRPIMGSLAAPISPIRAEPPRMTSSGMGGDVASLMRGLVGAQANDSGWPTFSGKYVEYPRFWKEWWAYRHTYHGHVRDELVCRSLKENSLTSSVKILVNDIEDLREAWGTLDTCFDRPEKFIAEALVPVTKFKGYKAFDSGAVREFYSLLRAAMMGARKAAFCIDSSTTKHYPVSSLKCCQRLEAMGQGEAPVDRRRGRGGLLDLCGSEVERCPERGGSQANRLEHRKQWD